MKLYAVTIFSCNNAATPLVLCQVRDTASFGVSYSNDKCLLCHIVRQFTIKEVLMFVSREVMRRTEPGAPQTIEHQAVDDQPDTRFQVHAFGTY